SFYNHPWRCFARKYTRLSPVAGYSDYFISYCYA
ncbi:uncharacterized protein METZ01_LOCUS81248, partial [marine metagenome]